MLHGLLVPADLSGHEVAQMPTLPDRHSILEKCRIQIAALGERPVEIFIAANSLMLGIISMQNFREET
jgi:hypothetical protein